jgi:hypothetical protein
VAEIHSARRAALPHDEPGADTPRVGGVDFEPHSSRAVLSIVVVGFGAHGRDAAPPAIAHAAEPVASRLALDHVGAEPEDI